MRRLMLVPQYVHQFKCIGSECEDTCCAGWKVSIDETTYRKYKRVTDYELKQKLEKYIGRDRTTRNKYGIAKIRLEQMRCPFLTDNHLCEIHSKLGDDYLSNTCATYPRMNKSVNGVVEQSLTVSCPEAARLALLNQNSMEFDQFEAEFTNRDLGIQDIKVSPIKRSWKDYFWDIRMFIIGTLQNREYTLEERLFILGLFFNALQEKVDEKNIEDIGGLIESSTVRMLGGIYKDALKQIPEVVDIQLKLAKALVDIRFIMNINSSKYNSMLVELLKGLNFEEGVEIEENIKLYNEGYKAYYEPFMDAKGYIMENYLVNYAFKELMPIDVDQPYKSYVRLILHYVIVKLHLIGIAKYNQGLTEEKIVQVIQSLGKTYEHNNTYFNKLLNVLEENGYDKLSYMMILIKN